MTNPNSLTQQRLDHALIDALQRARALYISAVTSQSLSRLEAVRYGSVKLNTQTRYSMDAKLAAHLREAAEVAGQIFDAEVYRSIPELAGEEVEEV